MDWKKPFENKKEIKIRNIQSISGGDISNAYKIQSTKGEYFMKVHQGEHPVDFYEKEVTGLKLLSKGQAPIPEKVETFDIDQYSFLLMEYIETTSPSIQHMQKLGSALANLHAYSSPTYGLHVENYIGKLPQKNTENPTWVSFYLQERLLLQLKLAVDNQQFQSQDIPSYEIMEQVLTDMMPSIKPALLHGDLWSGNFLSTKNEKVFFIDPAPYYGHSEVDIAMTQLFGGFNSAFYQSYFDRIPQERQWTSRKDIYQLYYLLVHLNLFGNAYYGSVKEIIKKYFT